MINSIKSPLLSTQREDSSVQGCSMVGKDLICSKDSSTVIVEFSIAKYNTLIQIPITL